MRCYFEWELKLTLSFLLWEIALYAPSCRLEFNILQICPTSPIFNNVEMILQNKFQKLGLRNYDSPVPVSSMPNVIMSSILGSNNLKQETVWILDCVVKSYAGMSCCRMKAPLTYSVLMPEEEIKFFISTLLFGSLKSLKVFIKPFEAPQRSVTIKIEVNFYFDKTFWNARGGKCCYVSWQ